MKTTRACALGSCGRPFEVESWRRNRFCSRRCAQRRPDQGGWRKEDPSARYRVSWAPGHPLVVNSPLIAEHRTLLFDAIGWGPHPCHYCARPVVWLPGEGEERLLVDHKNRDTHDNSEGNLVPSCSLCSTLNRAVTVLDHEPHRVRADGARRRGVERTCEGCGEPFVAWPSKDPRRGRFCSRSCARRAPSTR